MKGVSSFLLFPLLKGGSYTELMRLFVRSHVRSCILFIYIYVTERKNLKRIDTDDLAQKVKFLSYNVHISLYYFLC